MFTFTRSCDTCEKQTAATVKQNGGKKMPTARDSPGPFLGLLKP